MTTTDMLIGTVRAEVLKLRKRPAWWILVGILFVAIVLFGYLLNYAFLTGEAEIPGLDVEAIRTGMLPENAVPTILSPLAGFGGPIALILAAMFIGSEYGWGTVKTLATQRPGRTTIALGKAVVLVMAALVLVLVAVVSGILASFFVASLEGAALTPPPALDVLGGLGAGWLILTVHAAIGGLLAVVFRGVGLAIGLGLVYFFLIETALLALPLPDWFGDTATRVLLTPNALGLAGAFGVPATGPGIEPGVAPAPATGAAVLALYAVVCTAVGVLTFNRRSIA